MSLFFSACSTKEVFEPKDVKGYWKNTPHKNSDILYSPEVFCDIRDYPAEDEKIVDVTSNLALLEDGSVLTKNGPVDIKIKKNYRLLDESDGWILSSTIDGNLTMAPLDHNKSVENFELHKTIATASAKGDILAVLYADNEMALYSIKSKELLFKLQGNAPLVVDSRMVSPYFMNDLVLFLTLDGKVVIVNYEMQKKLRTIIISWEEYFNNVIYFNVVDSKLIAATGHKILSLASKEIRANHEIRTIIYDNKDIFITTKQGEVISLTPSLAINAKTKFPFAHFLGMILYKDKLYLLEKEGYIIELSKDLLEYSVYEVDIDDGYIFIEDKKFYVNNKYISVE